MNEKNSTSPTYLYTSERHKKETNKVQKDGKYCTRKEGNKPENILRISSDSQQFGIKFKAGADFACKFFLFLLQNFLLVSFNHQPLITH